MKTQNDSIPLYSLDSDGKWHLIEDISEYLLSGKRAIKLYDDSFQFIGLGFYEVITREPYNIKRRLNESITAS